MPSFGLRPLLSYTYSVKTMEQTYQSMLEVAIGQRIAELLDLKFSKSGRTNTTWGTKSIQGLGACIDRITEEEKERLKDWKP